MIKTYLKEALLFLATFTAGFVVFVAWNRKSVTEIPPPILLESGSSSFTVGIDLEPHPWGTLYAWIETSDDRLVPYHVWAERNGLDPFPTEISVGDVPEDVSLIYRPDDPADWIEEEPPMPEKDLTLREAFERHWLPVNQYLVEKSTASEYRTLLKHWEAFVAERASCTRTGAPETSPAVHVVDAVSQITGPMLDAFGAWLLEADSARPAMRQSTVGKYSTKLHAIFVAIGPRSSRYPQSPQLVDYAPKMTAPERLAQQFEEAKRGRDLDNDELGAIYDACAVATWPEDEAALQWQTYIVVGSLIGLRPGDGAKLHSDQFCFESQIPIGGRKLEHGPGWVDVTAQKTRKRQVIPLPPAVSIHAQELIRRRSGSLYQWRNRKQAKFCDTWQEIVSQAGLSEVDRKDLRSTCKNRWDRAGDGIALGEWVLGHAAKGVSDKHYTDRLPDLIAAAPRVEAPVQFSRRLRSGSVQTFLF